MKIVDESGEIDIKFSSIFEVKVGRGNVMFFWFDQWAGDFIFASKFPWLFSLERRKIFFIEERICPDIGGWAWKRQPNHKEELDELNMLRSILSNHTRSGADDTLRTKLSSDGRLLASSVRNLIDSYVSCPMQMAQSGITRHGININDLSYSDCVGVSMKPSIFLSSARSLLMCFVGFGIGVPLFLLLLTPWEIITFATNWGSCPKKKHVILSIVYGCFWCIWRAINDLIFNNI
ncbi:unnamed protein product [Lactuca saligna]|uniref:Uncharacterized protein n=1 Tax=Lactuca saligna TaxID=75948 RepID=A0AA35Z675_LACSI|nr:unnamed protein product [Lactuca saligna]